ncbi:MAG: hypothetical protein GDA48_17930 [Hormoscilla sp. GM102CHS1]|nr:hypothetical protein [Hormoscilla sp. GM102CHS1]
MSAILILPYLGAIGVIVDNIIIKRSPHGHLTMAPVYTAVTSDIFGLRRGTAAVTSYILHLNR